MKEVHRDEDAHLTKVHTKQLEDMWRRHEMELLEVEEEAEDRVEHLRKEIELLENEMGQLPADLLLKAQQAKQDVSPSGQSGGSQLSELELELQCCSCQKVCRPPASIYQVLSVCYQFVFVFVCYQFVFVFLCFQSVLCKLNTSQSSEMR